MKNEIVMTVGEGEDILSNSRVLDKLMQRNLSFKFMYWFNRIIKRVRMELEPYFDAKRELVELHVQKNEDNTPVTSLKDGIQQFVFKTAEDDASFREKIGALREDLLKLSGIFELEIDFDDPKFNELSGHEVAILMPMINNANLLKVV